MKNEIINGEMMNYEQLDQVAGGYCEETADDSRFLNSLGRFTNRYGVFRIVFENHDAEICHGWKMVGVDAEIHSGNFFDDGEWNVYKINGKIVSEKDARNHAMEVTGHHMEWEDWNW